MPARPSVLPPEWATGNGRRGTIGSGDVTQGAFSVTPVPSLKNNELWGRFSDWARFFALSVVSGCTYQGVFFSALSLPWQPYDAGGAPGDTTIAYNLGQGVTVTKGGTDRQASAVLSPVMAGGTPTAVEISIGALTTTSGTAFASVSLAGFDILGTGPASAVYSANITTTGTITLPLTSGGGAVYGPMLITVTIRSGTGAGDSIRVSDVNVEY